MFALACHLALILSLIGLLLTTLNLHAQISELEAHEFSRVLTRMCSGSVDHQQTIWGPIRPGPLFISRVILLYLVGAFSTVLNCISLCIFVFAPISV